jgi:hypothetical protein
MSTRTLTQDLQAHIGETVTMQGWLHKKRLLGGLNFITLRDRRGIAQSLLDNKDELEKLRGLQIGTVLALTGTVVADDRAPGGAELHDVTVEVMVPVTEEPPIEIDKPISHKSENLDTLFDYRVLNIRNLQEQKIFKIRASLTQHLREFLISANLLKLTRQSCSLKQLKVALKSSSLITLVKQLRLPKAHSSTSKLWWALLSVCLKSTTAIAQNQARRLVTLPNSLCLILRWDLLKTTTKFLT